ncbi:MAG: AbrB/MazE/SpoVT family DNA-binding domain-containing protein [Ruminiclostridium sp.]
MFHKKISSSRGITLPKALAFETGIDANTPVDVYNENGRIIIAKHVPECRFCGDKLRVKAYKGIEICPACAEKLSKEVLS